MEDTPDFAFEPSTHPYRAGVRPYRDKTYRLESETIDGKLVVHNYGHGGAGITMSWGCAEIVRDMIAGHGASGGVAVLGAGVMGLTVATLLTDARFRVTVYADKFTPHTTSDVAGGQWAPSLVNFESNDRSAKLAYFDVLRRARKAHDSRIGTHYGVSRRWNYSIDRIRHLDILPTDIVSPADELARLPFAKLNGPGFRYDLLLVEPPILMARLQSDLAAAGVVFVKRKFHDANALSSLKEQVIANCTGFGSRDLFQDRLMRPLKGQLVFLKPQPNLQYLFSGRGSYVFPRADAVVVGGSQEPTENDEPEPAKCKEIVAHAKRIFGGDAFPLSDLPNWMIQNK